MDNHRIFSVPFASIYPLYITKVERKGRTRDELHQVLSWLTGHDDTSLAAEVEARTTFEHFFERAPAMNPARMAVTGVICGVRIENLENPLMREIRILDKLVDELAKGRAMEKILRS